MIVAIDLLIFIVLIVTAVLALRVRDLLTAVALLASYSLFVALLFTGIQALDVALVEAALGAGLTGVMLVAAIMVTTRHSTARERPNHRFVVLALVAAFLGLMLYSSTGLPDRGDPDAPTRTGVAAYYLEHSMRDTQTPNVVTSLLADYRSLDTLGETLVILTAALAVALVLSRREDDEPPGADARPDAEAHPTDPGDDQ